MKKTMLKYVLFIVSSVICGFASASDEKIVQIESVTASFSPVTSQQASIQVQTTEAGKLAFEIVEPDGNVIQRIVADKPVKPGNHKLSWDGKDSNGQTVPDEAYGVRVTLLGGDNKVLGEHDPAKTTGGEMIDNLRPELSHTHIGFHLPDSARVLVRIGLKDGPMLKNVLRWAPRVAGKNRVSWDGFDGSGIMDLRQDNKTTALAVGYKLPQHSTITFGNNALSYAKWFEMLDLTPKSVPVDEQLFERGSMRIAREYYRSQFEDRESKIKLDFLAAGKAMTTPYVLSGKSTLRVNADEAAQWLLDESLYEVGFFVDGVFVSEEEQGYLPMSWRLNTDQYSAGEHFLTVNISGFDGRVGVASTMFKVQK